MQAFWIIRVVEDNHAYDPSGRVRGYANCRKAMAEARELSYKETRAELQCGSPEEGCSVNERGEIVEWWIELSNGWAVYVHRVEVR